MRGNAQRVERFESLARGPCGSATETQEMTTQMKQRAANDESSSGGRRDPRTMNNMDPETKEVHARLTAWGRWCRDTLMGAWPERTLLARLIEEGPSGASQGGPPPTSMPELIAKTDEAVAHLGEIDRGVIRLYYLTWEPVEVLAKKNGMRLREFQNVLRRARWRIGGYLHCLEH